MASSVDLSGAIRFDLASGAVHVGDDARAVVVPADVLVELCNGSDKPTRTSIGRKLGGHLGRQAAKRAGGSGSLLDGGLEQAASLLAAELALSGLGSCNLERWGKALVVHLVGMPAFPDDVSAAILEGALSAATGRPLACALLTGDNGVRVLVASEGAAARVRGWIENGTPWSDALVRLQSGGAS
jgi:hypothetical protein